MNRRTLILGALGTAGVIGAGALVIPSQPEAQALTVDQLAFDPDNPVLGNPQGDVTIVEFFDYQCPYCRSAHQDLETLLERDGNVRLVMRDWPIFGGVSVRASQLVLGSVASGNYARANGALMEMQGRLTIQSVEQKLTKAGLDVAALDASYKADRAKWDGLMARSNAQALALDLQGTPAFIIGNHIYPGVLNRQALNKAVKRARR